jgi:rubrerythrin
MCFHATPDTADLEGWSGLSARSNLTLAPRQGLLEEGTVLRTFKSLNEREILALAISLEEEDARIYDDFAEGLAASHPSLADQFRQMRADEDRHRHRLLDLYRQKFGEHIPLIRRQDVKGFVRRRPVWLVRPLGADAVRKAAETMEMETQHFYEASVRQATDTSVRQLLGDLAEEERRHARTAETLAAEPSDEEAAARKRLFVLQVVQPGLAGLMDGSVSTLAPLFAAAFATHNSSYTFLVGLAASVGAGISMGFAEALSDDGSLTGRGRPWVRGGVCGLMTALGGLGHTLPYLIPAIHTATVVAIIIVLIELGLIAWVRHRFMDTSWWAALFQVVLGGLLVFLTGILIGSS